MHYPSISTHCQLILMLIVSRNLEIKDYLTTLMFYICKFKYERILCIWRLCVYIQSNLV